MQTQARQAEDWFKKWEFGQNIDQEIEEALAPHFDGEPQAQAFTSTHFSTNHPWAIWKGLTSPLLMETVLETLPFEERVMFNLETSLAPSLIIPEVALTGAIGLMGRTVEMAVSASQSVWTKGLRFFRGGEENFIIPETMMEIPKNPISPNNIGASELASFSSKVYKEVKAGIYFQAQRFGQKSMGQFFTSVKPLDSMDAEEMLNIKAWGNNVDQVAIVEIKPGLMAWQGGIKGGAGEQLFIPHELHPDFITTLDVEPLYVEELKWPARP